MRSQIRSSLTLLPWLPLIAAASSSIASPSTAPAITPPPAGPYHVEGSRLIDSHGRPYRINGTRLAPVTISETDLSGAPGEFGPLSATTIVTIRQRLNMNAVRLPVDPDLYSGNSEFRRRTRTVVTTANQMELLVILESKTDSPDFWGAIAADFRDKPNVFFALPPSRVFHGYCSRGGCHVQAKNSTAVTTIPVAVKTKNLTIFDRAQVTRIGVDSRGRASGVTYLRDGNEYFQPARVVLLASYTYENSRLLLLSKSPAFLKGLSNNHGQVGRHYFGHWSRQATAV